MNKLVLSVIVGHLDFSSLSWNYNSAIFPCGCIQISQNFTITMHYGLFDPLLMGA